MNVYIFQNLPFFSCIALEIGLLIPYENLDSTVWFRNKNRRVIIV